ncbi:MULTISPECIES: M20 family metallopeptidase [unclassified Dysgonomonas]|uniref:M20 metallopeptidase family protein n=1 Tax=unclassified Dysgonomonas TaxID=2630389 RepID=UPI0016278856|nr:MULTISPECIES: amidohydrolase [unclassified Dysgonomonas]
MKYNKMYILVILLIQSISISAQTEISDRIHQSIRLETDSIFDRLVEIRRDFHKYPELSSEEKRTQEAIKKHLLELGLRVETDIYGYGIVGILEGEKKGKNIAWRADMDALPDDSPDNVDFKSMTKGVKHSCGHDVHMTIALGIAEVLAKNKNSLQGTVYFIFQPEEETFEGAKGMLENGLITKFKVDEIYGLHVTPASVGQILVKPNEMFPYQKEVRIELKNTLSEEEAKELATKIRNSLIRSKDGSKPWELQSLIDPEIGLTNPNTIFKDFLIAEEYFRIYSENDKLYIEAQLFETDSARLKNIIPTIKKVIEDENYSPQLLSVSYIRGNPIVQNDPKLTNSSINVLDSIYGKGIVTACYGQVPYSNDDFAYFQQKIPGVYFFLGGSNFEKGIIAMMHAPYFGVDEECIRIGVRAFSSLIFERLK